jgi:cysteine dioxygenase
MKHQSLPNLVEFLCAQSVADFRGDAVDRYLTRNKFDQDDFVPFIYFREDTYGRNLVYKNSEFELLVLTWLPKQRTPIHDHAGQRCWMHLLQGRLCFRNYQPIVNAKGDLVPAGPLEFHETGEAVYVDDGIGTHSIANASEKPAISMHLYAGPIPKCRIYHEAKKQFEWVELDYFTSPEVAVAG